MGFTSHLPQALAAMDKAEEDCLIMIGELIATAAKKLAPVSTIDGGTLRQSIHKALIRDGKRRGVMIGSIVEYAIYVEKGTGIYAPGGRKTPWVYWSPRLNRMVKTRGMKAQPFLMPAAFKNTAHIRAIVKEVYGRLNNDNH